MSEDKVIVINSNEPTNSSPIKKYGIYVGITIVLSAASFLAASYIKDRKNDKDTQELIDDTKYTIAESNGISIQIDIINRDKNLTLSEIEDLKCHLDSLENAMVDVSSDKLSIEDAIQILGGGR